MEKIKDISEFGMVAAIVVSDFIGRKWDYTNRRKTFRAFKWYSNEKDAQKIIKKIKMLPLGTSLVFRSNGGFLSRISSLTLRVPYINNK